MSKVIVITGASSGLGRALSHQLAAEGHRLVLVARREGPLAVVVSQIREKGGQAIGIPGDIGDPEFPARLVGSATAVFGPVEVLIHNASTLGPLPMPLLLDTPPEVFQTVLTTNLIGPFRLTRLVAGHMSLLGEGMILHISSDAAVAAYPGWGAYGVSKAAQDHLSRILAEEHPELKVYSLDPGEMNTPMHADALPEADPNTLSPPEQVARAITTWLPIGKPSGRYRFNPDEGSVES